MTTEEMRIAIAEKVGFVWYRHPSANSLQVPHYKFLALPAIHEIDQSDNWKVRSDGTEKPCAMAYMEREFLLPNYPADLNAMHEAESVLDNIELACYCEILLKHRHYTGWSDNWIAIHATAAQRAEAFCRVFWPEKFNK